MAMTEWEIRRTALRQKCVQILICDDDPTFLKELVRHISLTFAKMNIQADISAFCKPSDVSTEQLQKCDIAFFDIDFEDGECNGIDISRRLRTVNGDALIFFVTNFIDYAPAGYEVRAFRYILKRDTEDVLERYLLQAMEHFAETQEYLRLQSRDAAVQIPLTQILYLEVMDHSVSIHAGEVYALAATLSSLESQLTAHGFLRIHKSYLVNMCHVRKLRSRECLLSDGTALTVSEKNYAQQKQKYLLWKGLK